MIKMEPVYKESSGRNYLRIAYRSGNWILELNRTRVAVKGELHMIQLTVVETCIHHPFPAAGDPDGIILTQDLLCKVN